MLLSQRKIAEYVGEIVNSLHIQYVSVGYTSGQGATLIADTGAGKQKLGVLPAWKKGTVVTLRLNNWEEAKYKWTP